MLNGTWGIRFGKQAPKIPKAMRLQRAGEQGKAGSFLPDCPSLSVSQGVKQDDEKAPWLYLKAVLLGVEDALEDMADIYLHGSEKVRNTELALKYLKHLSDQGNKETQHKLALIYLSDEIVPQNFPWQSPS